MQYNLILVRYLGKTMTPTFLLAMTGKYQLLDRRVPKLKRSVLGYLLDNNQKARLYFNLCSSVFLF